LADANYLLLLVLETSKLTSSADAATTARIPGKNVHESGRELCASDSKYDSSANAADSRERAVAWSDEQSDSVESNGDLLCLSVVSHASYFF